jgi:dipeptidyl aminopeptidase/acylaminoacyl peptidase
VNLTRRLFVLAAPLTMLTLLFPAVSFVDAQSGYQKPPGEVLKVLNAPPSPVVSISPTGDRMLLLHQERYPSIAELAEPMLKLAGSRINPANTSPHRPPRFLGYSLLTIADKKETKVTVPANAHLGMPVWSPDGKKFAFTVRMPQRVGLWIGGASSGSTATATGITLNAAFGSSFRWMPDNRTLVCETVPVNRGKPPEASRVPKGPNIQESGGKVAPVRTYQDLLQNKHDEALYEYYATSQLVLHDTTTGKSRNLGKPGNFSTISPSPDGKHLLVTSIHRPYSFLHPANAFPRNIEVWDLDGKLIHTVAKLPLADQVPIEGVPTGPRQVQWHPTEPATLVWVEALDGGNPRKKVPHRDRILIKEAPFAGEPRELFKTTHRFAGLTWGEKDGVAFVKEYERERRWERTYLLNRTKPGEGKLVWDLSTQDRYRDPGDPVMRTLPSGHRVMRQQGNAIYLAGKGATPEGDRPFMDRFDLTTQKAERLFRCDEKQYEEVVALLAADASRFVTRHESPTEPPNYYVRTADGKTRTALTRFADPVPQIRGISKQLVTYKRGDGVPLSFTLYLPSNYKKGERLPAVVWAYPREYVDAGTAGQVSGSPHRFTTISGPSHLFFLTQGYAVLDGATMPVIGDPETVNNTYLEQIVSSAKAAIDKGNELGVIDPKRVGVGGHSYGAFMTANLLAHSDLFRAGIARSGAYNRTLTPFGFQTERRTFWEAPEMYIKVSPFMHAHKINEPILLIHGEMDNNPGTFPVQSERLYHAIKGNGGVVRYVTLPHESHGYAARESIEHTLHEMIAWFDKHVKNAPTSSTSGGQ